MTTEELFKALKEIKLSQTHYEGFNNVPFGVQISGAINIRGDHGDYLKLPEAQFILLCLNNRDMILNVLEDDLMTKE